MKTYYFFIVCLIAVTHVHVMFECAPRKSDTKINQYTLCTTDECVNTASEILAKLNRKFDPCDNFYKFACDGWLQNNRANRSSPKIDVISELLKKTKNQLREILEEPAKAGDTISLDKAKRVFQQCMSTRDSKTIETGNLSAIVNRYGGWPMIMSYDEWDQKNLTWQIVSNILHENHFDNGLYNIKVTVDNKMSNSNVIVVTEPFFSLSGHDIIHLNKTSLFFVIADKEKKYIMNVAKDLINEIGGNVDIKHLRRDVLDILHFEAELANLNTFEEQVNFDAFYIPLTIQQLQKEYDKQYPEINGKIDWHTTIQKIFASEGITIESSEKLVVEAYKYLTNLAPLLERTPSRTIVNYMQWTVLRNLFWYKKQPKANSIARSTKNADSGQNEKNERWKACVHDVNLKFAISHEYVKKYASNVDVQAIREITTDIESAIREQISRSTWMDEPTKKASLEKIANIKHEFFQPNWYSNEAIDNYYKDLNVSMGYLENVVNILNFDKKKMIGLLRTSVDREDWFQEPTIPNVYNIPFLNKIVFTAPMLQDPVYNKSRLPLVNYGTLGPIIAHEINHVFDTELRYYNQHSNIVSTWWTQESIDKYKNITQCFIDQYNNYLVPGLEEKNVYVDGQWTVDENLSDNAGIVSAYYAYRNRKPRLNETEWRIQGLDNYNNDQIFFMIYAQLYCETALPAVTKLQIAQDTHTVNEIRIRGSLSNFYEFSKIYRCSLGIPMNPEKKCALWH